MNRKGIILAGGKGTRLYPATNVITKSLLPIYDKPMIYYPLSTLMLADIKEILIISTTKAIPFFEELLGNGNHLGIHIEYAIQNEPKGIADALIIAEDFLAQEPAALILGDNIFYGHNIQDKLTKASKNPHATLFLYQVDDPERFGIAEIDNDYHVLNLEEKPDNPKSNYAVTGLYFYSNQASNYAQKLEPSNRGELEITDLNKIYLQNNQLDAICMGCDYSWFDTGTHESMLEAHQFVQTIEKSQGYKIACLEEIAFSKKWINSSKLEELAKPMLKNSYGQYLNQILNH